MPTSPMDHLKAFALAFTAGVATALGCVGFAKYIERRDIW